MIDLMIECNPKGLDVEKFSADICAQCANPKCNRSRYNDTATQQKKKRHETLLEYKDPTTVPLSPLSDEIRIHRVEIASIEETSNNIDNSVKTLGKIQGKVELNKENIPQKICDSWTAYVPKNPYQEYQEDTEDPWSPKFSGAMNIKTGHKATIRMPGGSNGKNTR